MLNNTVCNGVRLSAVIRTKIPGAKNGINIGYKLTPRFQNLREGIPLSISSRPPKFFLGFFMHLEADDAISLVWRLLMLPQNLLAHFAKIDPAPGL